MNKHHFFALLIIIAILFFLSFQSMHRLCNDNYSKKTFSPDSKYFSQVLTSSCGGAVGDFTTNVVVSKVDERYLIFFGYNRTNVLAIKGTDSLNLSWEKNNVLRVKYTKCNNAYSKKNLWKNIKVIFDEECSPS